MEGRRKEKFQFTEIAGTRYINLIKCVMLLRNGRRFILKEHMEQV